MKEEHFEICLGVLCAQTCASEEWNSRCLHPWDARWIRSTNKLDPDESRYIHMITTSPGFPDLVESTTTLVRDKAGYNYLCNRPCSCPSTFHRPARENGIELQAREAVYTKSK